MASDRIRIEQHSGVGLVWFAAWLFTIGYLDLSFWRGALAILIWPYDIGTALAAATPVGGGS
ncbi:hypothetical protein [Histidinibacterium aquaticum]|uniref:Uncharacterized protein n=1 Tax=Histidinibacterium aquaticum TaxID=2613962 RepID=A0A5J5GEP1_9RHOB|nr:hypothetical protein [Histidinibacterium aquaticum]KAA9006716.1 hypothetical protein F3S47_13105 [Histidinibacterium aquaticum]